ncbi:MAG: tRNA glutamyl-Q(34) synthetase GluQRS [Candidatus Thiodiazotropha sp. LLP2]
MTTPTYRGRFAPSPTGSLHFGSLVAAVGSFLDARHYSGEWLVRIEDLDRTREVAGAASSILNSLENFGFYWDGEITYQSHRTDLYAEVVDRLLSLGLAYPCSCSRKTIQAQAVLGDEGPIYPGTCRSGPIDRDMQHSIRVMTQDMEITIQDRVQGSYSQNLAQEIGDFVIRRSDGFHAYQLAVVIDDAMQKITHVVRGTDLLSSSPRQRYLQQLLGFSKPNYLHLPLAIDHTGRKLSKQDKDAPVDPKHPMDSLLLALEFLRQPLPPERPTTLDELWHWSINAWRSDNISAKANYVAINPAP